MTAEQVIDYLSDIHSNIDEEVASIEDEEIFDDSDGLSEAESEHSEYDTDSNISEPDSEVQQEFNKENSK